MCEFQLLSGLFFRLLLIGAYSKINSIRDYIQNISYEISHLPIERVYLEECVSGGNSHMWCLVFVINTSL